MKTFLRMTVAFLTFGLVAEAHAAWAYVDTPEFMTDAYPDTYACDMNVQRGRLVYAELDCVYDDASIQASTLVRDLDTGRQWVEQERMKREFDCPQRYCMEKWTEQLVGYVPEHLANVRFYGTVTLGYYIAWQGEQWYAFKNGTGPRAEQFMPYMVLNQQSQPTQAAATTTYDLWCNPRADQCNYTDAEGVEYLIPRNELPNYIPMASNTANCIGEVCYNANDDVIGLNPDYTSYH